MTSMKRIEESLGVPLRRLVSPVQRIFGTGILATGAIAMMAELIGH
ncbi:hypothetical protein [Sphingomonas quercus]|uniref:Uncharacterized protein n=1 Tax=Sphingomonas quercus TaxID=2842451 RepID=A0ABS6BMH0_9SPHN|nr:hypothetical protein [Sphingomonas quercus]MBU3079516.1 hypothetical protein [Sphingomonas quercus]